MRFIPSEERKRLAPFIYRCRTCHNSEKLQVMLEEYKDEPNLFWILVENISTTSFPSLNTIISSPHCPPELLHYFLLEMDSKTKANHYSYSNIILKNPNLLDSDLISYCQNPKSLDVYEIEILSHLPHLPEEIQNMLIDKGRLKELVKTGNLNQKNLLWALKEAVLPSQVALAVELIRSSYALSEGELIRLLNGHSKSIDFKKLLALSPKITEKIAWYLATDNELFASRELASNPYVPKRYRVKMQTEQRFSRNQFIQDPSREVWIWEPPFLAPLVAEYEAYKAKRLSPPLEITSKEAQKYSLPISDFLLLRLSGQKTWDLVHLKSPYFLSKLSLPKNLTGSSSYLQDPITKQIFLIDFYSQEDGMPHSILIPGSIPTNSSSALQEALSILEKCPLDYNYPPLENSLFATPKAHIIFQETLITLWSHQENLLGWTVETEGAKYASHPRKIYPRELNPRLSTFLLKELESTIRPLVKTQVTL